MKSTRNMFRLFAAIAAIAALDASARAQTLDKFQFRLNWTLYGEHAPFFVALDKGFYKEEGLELNVVRLRSHAGNLGHRYVIVNIPAALVETVEDGLVVTRHWIC